MRIRWPLGVLVAATLGIATTSVAGSTAVAPATLFPYPALPAAWEGFSKVMAVADLNRDGIDDIVLSSYGLRVFIGRGDGSFETRPISRAGGSALAIADFNHDGNPDIATAGAVLLGDGEDSWAVERLLNIDGGAVQMVAGDLNGDRA